MTYFLINPFCVIFILFNPFKLQHFGFRFGILFIYGVDFVFMCFLLLQCVPISFLSSLPEQQEFGLLKDKWMLRRTKELLTGQLPRKGEYQFFIFTKSEKIAFNSFCFLFCFHLHVILRVTNYQLVYETTAPYDKAGFCH